MNESIEGAATCGACCPGAIAAAGCGSDETISRPTTQSTQESREIATKDLLGKSLREALATLAPKPGESCAFPTNVLHWVPARPDLVPAREADPATTYVVAVETDTDARVLHIGVAPEPDPNAYPYASYVVYDQIDEPDTSPAMAVYCTKF